MTWRVSVSSVKMLLGWFAILLFRLLPFRPPNVEPMLAAIMPFSTRYGLWGSFFFGFLGILAYDALTSGWGIWTLITAAAYGALGLLAHMYFARRKPTTGNFVVFGILGTLLYDALTGLTIGPLFFHQSFMAAAIGQIPFTLMHLLGTTAFAVTLSPALHRFVSRNESIDLVFARLGFTLQK